MTKDEIISTGQYAFRFEIRDGTIAVYAHIEGLKRNPVSVAWVSLDTFMRGLQAAQNDNGDNLVIMGVPWADIEAYKATGEVPLGLENDSD